MYEHRGIGPDDVGSQNLPRPPFRQDLYKSIPVFDGRTVSGVVVVVAGDRIIDPLLIGLPLGQPNPGHLRRREYGVGHGIVVDSKLIFRIEDVVASVGRLLVGAVLEQVLSNDVT